MQKVLTFCAALALLLTTACSPKVQPLVDEDGTDYGAMAASYAENPAALRDYVRGCEANEAQLVTLRQQLNQAQNSSGSMQGDLASAQNQAAQAQQEIQQLRQQLATLQAGRNDQVDTDKANVQGVIFQVQLGAYAQNRVDQDLDTGDGLNLTDQNGLQKVVVSQFRTYANAVKLRDRLRQMGVRDAFVVARNNGQRIEVPEALRMTGQG